MKKLQLFMLAITISGFAFSQGNPSGNLQGPSINNSDQLLFDAVNYPGFWRAKDRLNKIDGDPYPFPVNKTTLVILTKEGRTYKVPKGNYDSKRDKIVSTFAQDSVFTFNDTSIDYVVINKKKFKRYFNDDIGPRYCHQLFDGNISFLKNYTSRIIAGSKNPMTHQKISNDKYKLSHSYFISKDGKRMEPFRTKKKDVLKLFSDKKSEIAEYVKTNKLSYKDESDLVKIFSYYNSL